MLSENSGFNSFLIQLFLFAVNIWIRRGDIMENREIEFIVHGSTLKPLVLKMFYYQNGVCTNSE